MKTVTEIDAEISQLNIKRDLCLKKIKAAGRHNTTLYNKIERLVREKYELTKDIPKSLDVWLDASRHISSKEYSDRETFFKKEFPGLRGAGIMHGTLQVGFSISGDYGEGFTSEVILKSIKRLLPSVKKVESNLDKTEIRYFGISDKRLSEGGIYILEVISEERARVIKIVYNHPREVFSWKPLDEVVKIICDKIRYKSGSYSEDMEDEDL